MSLHCVPCDDCLFLLLPYRNIGLMHSRSFLPLLGLHWFISMFGQAKMAWAQSDLDQDNAQIQEQILSSLHPMLEDMPDRWETSFMNLPWINPRRIPWNQSLKALAMDSLGIGFLQRKSMDSLVRAHGRPDHAAFWMMLPWMEGSTALAFQQMLDKEFPVTELHLRGIKPGMDIQFGTRLISAANEKIVSAYNERWQYRIRQKFGQIGCAITLEKATEQNIPGLPGFYVQGKTGALQWILGDFHTQSGNRLFHNTLRIANFTNPWAHLPGTDIPLASCRMNSGNQVRGLSLQSVLGPHLLVTNSYALRRVHRLDADLASDPRIPSLADYQPNTLWIHSMAWQIQKPWGGLGLQSAWPSWLKIPPSWDSSLFAARSTELPPSNAHQEMISEELKCLGFNIHIQKQNYFFQSNLLAQPSGPIKALNKEASPSGQFYGLNLPDLYISQLHTLVLTPHPQWSMGLRWSRLYPGREATRWVNSVWPQGSMRQSLDINTQWSPIPYWSITWRSHWVEESPNLLYGERFIAWTNGLDGRILKGPFKDGRYTMIFKKDGPGRQVHYLFQYLRLPWPYTAPRKEDRGLSGFIQFAHGYSKPSQQTWALAYNMLWKRIFRTDTDLKIGQTWVIAGAEGERVTVREDQSFGAGWWTGSSRQYRFTASLQGRSGGYGWRLWVRRIEDELALRWETGMTFSQRWEEN